MEHTNEITTRDPTDICEDAWWTCAACWRSCARLDSHPAPSWILADMVLGWAGCDLHDCAAALLGCVNAAHVNVG